MLKAEFINSIRSEYSGLKDMPKQTLIGTLTTLADDLYEKDSHFIFELIQNAEDNIYGEGVEPKLVFEFSERSIEGVKKTILTVTNNELGFKEENVKAICQAAVSTKKKKYGYIGEKGIGFKSVFRVTTSPYIFSNGFHFVLPEHDEETGLRYLVPRWVETEPKGINRKETTILLPIDKKKGDLETVINSLKDISPETILFLSKINQLDITIRLKGDAPDYEISVEKETIKRFGNSRIVELSYLRQGDNKGSESIETTRYWLTEIEYKKPDDIEHEKRPDIKSRIVSIAIPLQEEVIKGSLFAYLPVWESTGFHFLINADFLLVSSREGIKEDEAWNKWLRSCVAETYISSFMALLKNQEIQFSERIRAYRSIPIKTNHRFLEPIIDQVCASLISQECVFVIPEKNLKLPWVSTFCQADLRSLIEVAEGLPSHLLNKLFLCCHELEEYGVELESININTLGKEDIIECLSDTAWLKRQSSDWLVSIYGLLAGEEFSNEDLFDTPLIPVVDKSEKAHFISPGSRPVYFPLDEDSGKSLCEVPKWITTLVPVFTIDSNLESSLQKNMAFKKTQDWVCEVLEIKDFSIENYCEDLQQELAKKEEELRDNELIEAALFIWKSSAKSFRWSSMPFVFESGKRGVIKRTKSARFIVPKKYDEKYGWGNIWGDDLELVGTESISELYDNIFIEFLIEKDLIKRHPNPIEVKELESDYTSYESKCIREVYSTYRETITNYRPPSTLSKLKNFNEAISLSIEDWLKNIDLSSFSKCYVSYFYYSSKKKSLESEFLNLLKTRNWLPTTKGSFAPHRVFIQRQGIKEVLGDTVAYYQGELPIETLDILGVRREISAGQLLEFLKSSSGDLGADPEMAERVYFGLAERYRYDPNSVLASHFSNTPLIFSRNVNGQSKWYLAKECVWEDASDVLGDDFAYLAKQYPELKDFFINKLEVREKVDTQSFAIKWLKLQKSPIDNTKDQRSILDRIYREIRPIALSVEKNRTFWWAEFLEEAELYVQSDTFVDPLEAIVPDDGELRKIFEKCDGIEFTWLPPKDSTAEWLEFYKVFSAPLLSESVTEELESDVSYDIIGSNQFITSSTIMLIATWLKEKFRSEYDRLQGEAAFSDLINMREAITDSKIQVTFEVSTDYFEDEVVISYPVFWNKDKNILIYEKVPSKSKVAKAIAKGLVPRKYHDLSDWIELNLGAISTDRLSEDKGWSVPREISSLFKSSKVPSSDKEKGMNDTPKTKLSPSDTKNPLQPQSKQSTKSGADTLKISSDEGESKPNQKTESQKDDKPNPEVTNPTPNFTLNYGEKLNAVFNKEGSMDFNDEYKIREESSLPAEVKSPVRRGEKLRSNYVLAKGNEPSSEERRKTTERQILEGPNEQVRTTLYEWYLGKCQICEESWPKKDGKPYFAAAYLVERQHARWIDEPGNALCLCAKHFAQWRHAAKEMPKDISEQIKEIRLKKEGGSGRPAINFTMLNEKHSIEFDERHFLSLRKLLEVSENDSSPLIKPNPVLVGKSPDEDGPENFKSKNGKEIQIFRHPLNKKRKTKINSDQLIDCPYCQTKVKESNFDKHLRKKCIKSPKYEM